MGETDRELGIKDKVLAEFILNLAKQSQGVDQFHGKLEENDSADELGIDLINSIYALVTRLLPSAFGGVARGQSAKPQKRAPNPEEKKYVSSGMHGDLDQPAGRGNQFRVDPNAGAVSDEETKEQERNALAQ